MKNYKPLSNNKAYKLLNTGSVILVSTQDESGIHNITPMAWQCPLDYDSTTKIIIVCDMNHKAFDNISKTEKYIITIPHASQKKLVVEMGSVSGKEVDKLSEFSVPHFISENFQIAVPNDCIGYMECKLIKTIPFEGVAIVIGEVVNCRVDELAFKDRLLSENEAGKTLHHLGSKVFISPGDLVN